MAEIIPALNALTLGRMTSGERRVARCMQALLDDGYLVWYDIPVGRQRRYPDFILLHPERGLLLLEVKDWKLDQLRHISQSEVTLLTSNGCEVRANPFDQVRQYAYVVIDRLKRDPALCHASGPYRGKLLLPYGWGVVFSQISRAQMEQAIPDEAQRATVFPDHLTLYREELAEGGDAEQFQSRLWGMFHYAFGQPLSLPQINQIRGHLYPEIRIDPTLQGDLFATEGSWQAPMGEALPELIRVMDLQQEQLARSMGEGHRVIHGVAGSGKTMILGFRCLYLAQLLAKPILVLCFNITLAAKLRAFISAKGIAGQVQIYHFHDWCGQQLKSYQVTVPAGEEPYWERQVTAVIDGVERGHIPRAQYGAVLIDEGHDFEAQWLQLVVQMVDPESNHLLLLYDDAQSIYRKGNGLGFSLASVGIEARGRTTVLRLNYRNTREILAFAYNFARHYLTPAGEGDAEAERVEPEAAGAHGPLPVVRSFSQPADELAFAIHCLTSWHAQGVAWRDMALLYVSGSQGAQLASQLQRRAIPHAWLGSQQHKRRYAPEVDQVVVLSIYSSKGLEFPRVLLVGVGELADAPERRAQEARLLYVGMTRAQEYLLVTTCGDNDYSRRLLAQDEGASD